MFTGIITDIGRVRSVEKTGDTRMVIETAYDTETLDLGASISCSGACMTVVEKGDGFFAVDVSAESLSKTTLGAWQAGTEVNLERALRAGDEMGGHIVSGHIDGVGTLKNVGREGDSLRLTFAAPENLGTLIASKGSVAIDGVSLTVNEVEGSTFGVNIIAHTQQMTTLGKLASGDMVNLEIDMLARYVARLLET